VTDAGSFRSWDQPIEFDETRFDAEYAAALRNARDRTGLDESIVTGEAYIDGSRVAIVAGEFGFLGGSIGVDAAHRLVSAIERATAEGLPLLAAPASGGTRMQEGTSAFVRMVAITDAVMRHRRARLPYLAYLRNPTTGGVFASWASLAHVTAAEPGALIGFLGPRATAVLRGEPLPEHIQRAEHLYRHGLLDAVVPAEQLREVAATALRIVARRPPRAGSHTTLGAVGRPTTPAVDGRPTTSAAEVDAWESVQRSRRPDRPALRALVNAVADDVVPLSGTGDGERDHSIVLMLATFGGEGCVVVGHERRRPLMPAGLRTARRGMRLAAELGLPLVTVIDSGGAALSAAAEEGGLAGEIAHCMADLLLLDTPVLCVLLGAGAGGSALALLPGDRVIAAQHAWLAPLSPEGASAIQHRTADRAAVMAKQQGVGSADLMRIGVVDRIVAECPDAADEPQAFLARMGDAIAAEVGALRSRPLDELVERRADRFRQTGRH
jgi:acetyl-CoA carboxylase carboxyl transferase subunit beta